MNVNLPSLIAIKQNIQDAFPGKEVSVWCEEPFANGPLEIRARVYYATASLTLDPRYILISERHISDLLIELLKEQMQEE